jgi:crotonobetainyl-CoA:carnitine CoA-transferase CaiB-like acyl-CoA transferase
MTAPAPPGGHLPLADLRVLDLTVARAGPTCVRQLADWGADVVRVEPFAAGPEGPVGQHRHGSDFQNLHRNKRSLGLDLKAPGAGEVLMRLVDGADVLVENMRPPVKARLGFDYATVHAAIPGSCTGRSRASARTGPTPSGAASTRSLRAWAG